MAKAAAQISNRVLLLKGDPLPADDVQPHPKYHLLQLPNPSTGQQQQYVLTNTGILEVNRVRHAASSWLVDQSFVSDGSAYLATPVNPVFVLVALLNITPEQQAAGMFQEVESLLCCEQWPDAQQLLPLAKQHLPCICDTKAVDEDTYYKTNPHKVLAFLRVFVQQSLSAFRSNSASSIAGLPEAEQQAYVVRFMREYLSQAWFDKLASTYNLSQHNLSTQDTNVPAVRSASASGGNSVEKKAKVIDPKEAARKKAEESRAATAAAKLQKQAAGSKKISSFFLAAKKAK